MPGLGTAALLSTRQGRNILAAELVVATAIATYYCGGCATLGTGALLGELSGGASAWSGGGDILSGVAVGGAVGLAVAGTSSPITGSLARQMVLGGLRGAAQGTALGAAVGWAGGNGSLADIRRSAITGAIIGGAIGALTPAVLGRNIAGDPEVRARLEEIQKAAAKGGLNVDIDQITVREGGLWNRVWPNRNLGMTLGNDVFFVNPDQSKAERANTLAHETHHALSWQAQGWQYTASYLDNPAPLERAARAFANAVYP